MINKFKVEIFADGADIYSIKDIIKKKYIKGITTNPSLMRKSGVKNYKNFSKEVLRIVKTKPVSFEVFADEPHDIEMQANEISKWGKNVFVKIPIMNTKKKYLYETIKKLSYKGIKLNITAVMSSSQVNKLFNYLCPKTESYISIFAGRIADTGRDPIPVIKQASEKCKKTNFKIIWASTREVYNIIQADKSGCHIITVGYDFLKKLSFLGYNLEKYTLDTVKTFYDDAVKSKFNIF